MSRDDLIRIRHMLDAAQEAESFVADRVRADLNRDRMLVLSLVKAIEIIGEAAAHGLTRRRLNTITFPGLRLWE